MNSLIEERNQRTRKRKKIKRDMDRMIGLSASDKEKNFMKLSVSSDITKLADNTIRLLDEGYFDNGFVIKKGTLEKYMQGRNKYVRGYEMGDDGWQMTDVLNLTNDFVGTVNLGHMDFTTFPFIIGEWTKEDLTLVETENDRMGIDVSVKLDEDSIFVQELKRQPYEIGISSEFYYHVSEEDTEKLSEMLGYEMPVIDEVFIFAYGLVGECGNVNSSGLELKGVDMAKGIENVKIELNLENVEEVKDQIEEVEKKLDEVNEELKELGVEEIDITVNEEEELENEEEKVDEAEESAEEEETVEENSEVAEEVVELSADDAEEADEAEAEDEESDEEDVIEEVSEDDDADDEDEIDEADELSEALAYIKALKAENAGLKDIIAELKKSNRKNAKKLAKEKEMKEEFLKATKELSIELLPNEEEAEKLKAEEEARLEAEKQYKYGDGIADI